MPSGAMDSDHGATAGPPDQSQHHQSPLPGSIDDGFSSGSPSRSSYSRDFTKPTNISLPKKTSLLSSLNPRNWTRKMRIFAIVAFVLTMVALVPAIAVPLTLRSGHQGGGGGGDGDKPLVAEPPTQPIADDMDLRIMSLGASITYGLRSTDRNGYRLRLRDLLFKSGTKDIQYVGSRQSGQMTGNAVEGWPGLRLDQVLPKARASVPVDLPNVILINLGTNDCVQNFNMDNTTQTSPVAPELTSNSTFSVGSRMRVLINDLFDWSPNVTVVLSTLINNRADQVQARVLNANEQFRAVAAELQGAGKKVVLAEMSPAAGGPNMTTMFDQTHPNDVGYAMMANRFYEAMIEASSKGMITAPVPK